MGVFLQMDSNCRDEAKYLAPARCDIICLAQIAIYSVSDRVRYDINPPVPAGISLAAGEYRTRSVYRKSTKWIYIVEKTVSFGIVLVIELSDKINGVAAFLIVLMKAKVSPNGDLL